MPELAEYKISADFINLNSKNKFIKAFHVQKGNIPVDFEEKYNMTNFSIQAKPNGKDLILEINKEDGLLSIHVFMGMNGNWKYVDTETWSETRFTRLRFDDERGKSLILYGGYMGPKYSVGKPFTGTKRGVDPTLEFEKFKQNILENLDKKAFDKPICEVLLNQEYFNGIGAYLTAEIVGRLDFNPFDSFRNLSTDELEKVFNMTLKCCLEAYEFGGGELISWKNPIYESRIDEWIQFYNNKEICYKQKFGTRNIWIDKKFKLI